MNQTPDQNDAAARPNRQPPAHTPRMPQKPQIPHTHTPQMPQTPRMPGRPDAST
ncbi:MAG: hypothetical protein V8Q84_10530 [Bilophila sp.]